MCCIQLNLVSPPLVVCRSVHLSVLFPTLVVCLSVLRGEDGRSSRFSSPEGVRKGLFGKRVV